MIMQPCMKMKMTRLARAGSAGMRGASGLAVARAAEEREAAIPVRAR